MKTHAYLVKHAAIGVLLTAACAVSCTKKEGGGDSDVPISVAHTDRNGRTVFTDSRTGEQIVVLVRDSESGQPLEEVEVTYADGERFEAFSLALENYITHFQVFPPNASTERRGSARRFGRRSGRDISFELVDGRVDDLIVWNYFFAENPDETVAMGEYEAWARNRYHFVDCVTKEELEESEELTMALLSWVAGGSMFFQVLSTTVDAIGLLVDLGYIDEVPDPYFEIYEPLNFTAPPILRGVPSCSTAPGRLCSEGCELVAAEDSFVLNQDPDANHGDQAVIRAGSTAKTTAVTLLRFQAPVAESTIGDEMQGRLSLWLASPDEADGCATLTVWSSRFEWSEESITWETMGGTGDRLGEATVCNQDGVAKLSLLFGGTSPRTAISRGLLIGARDFGQGMTDFLSSEAGWQYAPRLRLGANRPTEILSASIAPAKGPGGTVTMMKVTVSDPDGPDDVLSIRGWVRQRPADQGYLFDDGSKVDRDPDIPSLQASGDETAGDGTYSMSGYIDDSYPSGVYHIDFLVTDRGGTSAATVTFTVTN